MANGEPDIEPKGNWTIDVQRGLAWTIVIVFATLLLALVLRVIVSGAATDSLELLKQGFNALINIAMMVMGYFFGSSKSSQSKDDTQNKIVEKLTSPSGPVTPASDLIRAAEIVAPAAAEAAAPSAAAVAAPPAAEAAAPAAAEKAVHVALTEANKEKPNELP